jgi:putative Holliday junction resolvase
MIANARESYTRRGEAIDLKYFSDLAKAEQADVFVVGLPKNMDGTEGIRVEITREFAKKLEEYSGIKVVFQDERLTTVSAEKMLISADVRRDKRKTVIDKVAACIILQSYLDNPRK